MKAITAYTPDEAEQMNAKYDAVKTAIKGIPFSDMFTDYRKSPGYAHYTFSGTITDRLVEALGHEPSADEIILIVDGGFSHFGASCNISNRHFSGKVYID